MELLRDLIDGSETLIARGADTAESERSDEMARECRLVGRFVAEVRGGDWAERAPRVLEEEQQGEVQREEGTERGSLSGSEEPVVWNEASSKSSLSPKGLRHLDPAVAAASHAGVWPPALERAFVGLSWRLPWSTFYARSEWSAPFIDDLVMATIIGVHAPVPSEKVALGFLIQGPNTYYPPHGHAARELYIVLGGGGWFRTGPGDHRGGGNQPGGNSDWIERRPGSCVFHDSHVCHAMWTGTEPLLALYTWTGDIVAPSWCKRDIDDPTEAVAYPPLLRD
jgi:hypothetical protein